MGREDGFGAPDGRLVFAIARIAKALLPKVIVLENVPNLVHHDNGATFKAIVAAFQEIGYAVSHAIVDASREVPQSRRRVFIVCHMGGPQFEFPCLGGPPLPLRSVLEPSVPKRFRISQRAMDGHLRRTERDKERGRGFSLKLADPDRPAPTISARYGKDGKECLVPEPDGLPRRLMPREVARLQGFPDEFVLDGSEYRAYHQLGNSVAIPVVSLIARKIASDLLAR